MWQATLGGPGDLVATRPAVGEGDGGRAGRRCTRRRRRAGGGAAAPPMFPVRCYTCNAVLAQMHAEYVARTTAAPEGECDAPGAALDRLGVRRMCCRRMFLGYVDLVTQQVRYPNLDRALDDEGTLLRRESRGEHVVSCD